MFLFTCVSAVWLFSTNDTLNCVKCVQHFYGCFDYLEEWGELVATWLCLSVLTPQETVDASPVYYLWVYPRKIPRCLFTRKRVGLCFCRVPFFISFSFLTIRKDANLAVPNGPPRTRRLVDYGNIKECIYYGAFRALTLLVGRQEGHPVRKNFEWWGAGMVVSGAKCKWLAYGPADATATPPSLLQ